METLPGRPRGTLTAEINVTPMVDVMLVLLIIFMVVTATLPYTATLPRAQHAIPAAEDRVTLGIDDRGGYWIGRTPVPAGQLPARLTAAYANRPGDHVLYLKADHGAPYALVLDAVEAARAVGVTRLGVITERARED
ncbi:MAG TPA: biopolymer transporter ExbD [Longimicrobium sp.]|nr:biopolymer transporter ExbD [Longimicrobium sp.]